MAHGRFVLHARGNATLSDELARLLPTLAAEARKADNAHNANGRATVRVRTTFCPCGNSKSKSSQMCRGCYNRKDWKQKRSFPDSR